MIHNINGVGQYGVLPDLPFTELPLNAWTRVQNVRFRDGVVEKFTGHNEVYPSAVCAPYWLLQVPRSTPGTYFWLYAGLTAVGAYDGSSHADITRAAGAYNADSIQSWTGTIIEGVPVITNGVDVPQMWNTPALATDLIALSAFPASTTCNVMRSLKRYLVAMDVTKSTGTRYPNLVKWSDVAPTGGVPTSWDETDETKDAGEYSLPSDGGYIQDMVPLRDNGIIYKTLNTWKMNYVAGSAIFDFVKVFDSIGSIGPRCAIEFFSGKHVVYSGDDIVLHDGVQAQSLLDKKAKSLLRGVVSEGRFNVAFVTVDYEAKEVWTCFVEAGYLQPSKAIVWNWLFDTISLRELPSAAFIASGIVSVPTDLWSSSSSAWSADTGAWADGQVNPNERKMLMAVPAETKLYQLDNTQQFDGTDMTCFAERTGIGFPLKKDSPPDFTTEKLFRGIWPRITGTAGGVVSIYVGTQDVIDGTVTWLDPLQYTIGTSDFLDFLASGRLLALRFESASNISWKLSGYDADVVAMGSR